MSEDCPHCVFEKTEANCRGCFEGSHYKPKPITNADRIRAMTDEELAEWITELTDYAVYPHTRKDALCISIGQTCTASWLEWLKQEADE